MREGIVTLTRALGTGCSSKLLAERLIALRIAERLSAALEVRNEHEPAHVLTCTFSTWHDVELVSRALRDWGEES